MARITEEEAKRLGIQVKPVKTIEKKIADIAIEEVRGKMRRKSKYGAEKVEWGEIDFDSKKERDRFTELKFMEKAGKITDLEIQPKFLLQDNFKYNGKTEKSISYIADFKYKLEDKTIVEDVKGFKTDVYKLKRKLFLFKYGHLYIFKET